MSLKWPNKDPDEKLDYSIDWSRYLSSDTISTVTWKIEDENGVKQTWGSTLVVNGLQHVSSSNTDTVATIQIALGTVNTNYNIYCQILTASSVSTERRITLKVREQT